MRGLVRCAAAVLLLNVLPACDTSPQTAPTPQPAPQPTAPSHPSVTITSVTVAGERRASGYAYRVVVHLRESAGVPATISSVDLTLTSGTATLVASHYEQPISDSANIDPANGAIDTRELLIVDADASHPYATTVRAQVTFTDGPSFVSTAAGTAEVPSLPAPATFTLTGRITDATTHAGIDGALLEVRDGVNGGKTASTDRSGTYVMTDLVAGSFRLRASASRYQWGEQGVAVPTNPRADFELRQSCGYTLSTTSVTASDPLSIPYAEVSLTRVGATTCAWTATTADSWIGIISPRSGSDSGPVTFFVSPNASVHDRTGTVLFTWEGGQAAVTVTQRGVTCPPSFTRSVGSQATGDVVFLTGGCNALQPSIDVPWLAITGTMAGTEIIFVRIDANPGPQRTGHLTFSGTDVSVQITYIQAGVP